MSGVDDLINLLITFRENGTLDPIVPVLSSDGRFRIEVAEAPILEVGTTAPTTVDGSVLWNNTTSGEEGIYFYDVNRSKWLSSAEPSLFWGEDTADGNVLEPVGVRTMPASGGYRMPQDGTITRVSAYSNSGNASKDFEVRINNVTPAALSYTTAGGVFVDNTLNIDFSSGDLINAGALAPGAAANDVTVIVYYRWRS